jgi:tetratricopeptide (TPR) repeat protein
MWLGRAYHAVAHNYFHLGQFDQALAAAGRAHALAQASGDQNGVSNAAMTSGISHAARGEFDAAVAVCQRGIDSAPYAATAELVRGHLGSVYLEKGDISQALPLLERAVRQMEELGVPIMQGWYGSDLSRALLAAGRPAEARAAALAAVELSRSFSFQDAIGRAEWALGSALAAGGDLTDAQAHLTEALEVFTTIRARFGMARAHFALAEITHAAGEGRQAIAHVNQARSLFAGLRLTAHVRRTEALAADIRAVRAGTPA